MYANIVSYFFYMIYLSILHIIHTILSMIITTINFNLSYPYTQYCFSFIITL